MTIHRLLEYPHPGEVNQKTGKPLVTTDPKKDRNNPIEFKTVLCDEYAMVNVEVHRNLLDSLPNGGVIRMFGDANQLQPIESNKRLQKMIRMMAEVRGAKSFVPHKELCIDNGAMIAWTALLMKKSGVDMKLKDTTINQRFRTDDVDVTWR